MHFENVLLTNEDNMSGSDHLRSFRFSLYVDYASNPVTAIYLLFKLHSFSLHLATRFQAVYEEPDRRKRCWLVMISCAIVS